MNFWNYIISNHPQILSLLIEHLKLTAVSVGLAILIGVPLGIFISFAAKASKPILAVANVIQAIPSMALLGFMIPLLGIGIIPAIVAVVLYSLLPIIKNTYTGIDNINYGRSEDRFRNSGGAYDHGCVYWSWRLGISGVFRHPDGE